MDSPLALLGVHARTSVELIHLDLFGVCLHLILSGGYCKLSPLSVAVMGGLVIPVFC